MRSDSGNDIKKSLHNVCTVCCRVCVHDKDQDRSGLPSTQRCNRVCRFSPWSQRTHNLCESHLVVLRNNEEQSEDRVIQSTVACPAGGPAVAPAIPNAMAISFHMIGYMASDYSATVWWSFLNRPAFLLATRYCLIFLGFRGKKSHCVVLPGVFIF